MAKNGQQIDLEQTIADLLTEVAPQIADAVLDYVATFFRGGGVAARVSVGPRKRGKAKGTKEKHTYPPHCLYPGCKNHHSGPRFSFLCEKHRGIPDAEKEKYMNEWRERRAQHNVGHTPPAKPKARDAWAKPKRKPAVAAKKKVEAKRA